MSRTPIPNSLYNGTTIAFANWQPSMEEDKLIKNETMWSYKEKRALELQLNELKAIIDSTKEQTP